MSDKRFPANIISSTAVEPTGSFEDSSASGTWSLQEAFTYVKAGLWPTAGNQKPLIEDVFSTYLYTGTGSALTITNGIDLAGEGGMTWDKVRAAGYDHFLHDTERTGQYSIRSNTTAAQISNVGGSPVVFNSDGYTLPSGLSPTGQNIVSWTFRKAPRFFDVVTFTGDGTGNKSVPHNLGVVPGFYTAKTTAIADNWFSYHRSLGATKYVNINSTGAAQTNSNIWGDTEPTDTHFTIGTGLNVSGRTYVIYLFAHDPLGPSGDGSDGLIACGSYTGNGSTTGPEIDLGWEPQWVLVKGYDLGQDWTLIDTMRGMTDSSSARLNPNNSQAEASGSLFAMQPNPTGFTLKTSGFALNGNGYNYIYIAIRRGPMRAPTSGTEVFAPVAYTGDAVDNRVITTGFPVDYLFATSRALSSNDGNVFDRMRGAKQRLVTQSTAAESTMSDNYYVDGLDSNTGFILGGSGGLNSNGNTFISHAFRRAPGFFDVVAYGSDNTTSQTISHNLTVTPEMFIVKVRDTTAAWGVYHKDVGNTAILRLNSIGGPLTSVDYFNNTSPTETDFTVGTYFNGQVGHPTKYIAYLFATLPGVSKVGSYTGNGTSQTIDCGFTTGARFILIKRTDSTGDWYVWDSARGIVAGNDPHLSLNTDAAEVTGDDSVDAESTGFIVNQDAATNVNVSSAEYIFLAIA